ncbi:MAG: branched-chain amino acid ABC transporter permease [Candidatus Marinimicrobia bacterium]|nr:branched-chain amino acid ABC transporter permease [Candidatus Neomarinimicrobiota bacterium]
MILQLIANGIVIGCVYALVALGFGLIYNTTRLFHFAHGVVYTTAAYVLFTLNILWGVNIFVAFTVAVALAAVLGMAMEILVYLPLFKRGSPGILALISSLGIYIFLVNLIALIFGNETKVLRPGIEKTYQFADIILTRIQVFELLGFLLIFPAFYLFLKKTKLGKSIKALSNNPELATVIGINVNRVRLAVFAIGSLLAGVAACLVALDVGIDPNIGLSAVLTAAVVVIVSGVGIFEAAALGAFLLGLTQNLVIWKISARWQDAITFIILIAFLLLRPQGILGKRFRLEEV